MTLPLLYHSEAMYHRERMRQRPLRRNDGDGDIIEGEFYEVCPVAGVIAKTDTNPTEAK